MVEAQCECGARLRLPDEWADKHGRCPRVHAVVMIPSLPVASDTPPVRRAEAASGALDTPAAGAAIQPASLAPRSTRRTSKSSTGGQTLLIACGVGGVMCVVGIRRARLSGEHRPAPRPPRWLRRKVQILS